MAKGFKGAEFIPKRVSMPAGDTIKFEIPNHSGDNSAGSILKTPVNPHDIPNKQYVDDLTTWSDYVPSSITLNTGTYVSGDVTSVQEMFNGEVYYVDEVAGATGFDIVFNFTNVDKIPNFIVTRWIYNGSATHNVTIDIWNYTTSSWDQVRRFSSTGGYYASMTQYIPTCCLGNYVSDGNSMVRFYHQSSGNAAHDIQIDYVGFTKNGQ